MEKKNKKANKFNNLFSLELDTDVNSCLKNFKEVLDLSLNILDLPLEHHIKKFLYVEFVWYYFNEITCYYPEPSIGEFMSHARYVFSKNYKDDDDYIDKIDNGLHSMNFQPMDFNDDDDYLNNENSEENHKDININKIDDFDDEDLLYEYNDDEISDYRDEIFDFEKKEKEIIPIKKKIYEEFLEYGKRLKDQDDYKNLFENINKMIIRFLDMHHSEAKAILELSGDCAEKNNENKVLEFNVKKYENSTRSQYMPNFVRNFNYDLTSGYDRDLVTDDLIKILCNLAHRTYKKYWESTMISVLALSDIEDSIHFVQNDFGMTFCSLLRIEPSEFQPNLTLRDLMMKFVSHTIERRDFQIGEIHDLGFRMDALLAFFDLHVNAVCMTNKNSIGFDVVHDHIWLYFKVPGQKDYGAINFVSDQEDGYISHSLERKHPESVKDTVPIDLIVYSRPYKRSFVVKINNKLNKNKLKELAEWSDYLGLLGTSTGSIQNAKECIKEGHINADFETLFIYWE